MSYSPPPLPPPEHQPLLNLQKPSLPEPEGPPPPPPIQNGYAFSTSAHYDQETAKAMDTLKRQKSKTKEPIYESIKPRPEPVGGSGNSPPTSEYTSYPPPPQQLPQPNIYQQQQQTTQIYQQQQRIYQQQQQSTPKIYQQQQQQPTTKTYGLPATNVHKGLPPPPSSDEQYGFGEIGQRAETYGRVETKTSDTYGVVPGDIYKQGRVEGPYGSSGGIYEKGSGIYEKGSSIYEKGSGIYDKGQEGRPRRKSAGSPGPGKRISQPTQAGVSGVEDQDREQRRLLRVRRELERIQEVEEENSAKKEEHHNIVEFAENFFNDHEKSPSGTIVGTIKRSKTMEMLGKEEMVSYYKGNSIPTSHIHMFDPENINLACNIFKELNKYAKGDHKGDAEVSVIQQIIQLGIERDELRDEIFVQIMRQITKNPSGDQVERLWLLMCLIVVAFNPSKALFKYFVSFLQGSVETEGRVLQYVQWCLDNSTRNQVETRRLPPSSVEIAAMKRLGTIVCRFFFLDGRTKVDLCIYLSIYPYFYLSI